MRENKYTKLVDWLDDVFGEHIYRPIYRFFRDPDYWYKSHIKWPLQVLFRGYGDDDLWGLDTFITRKIRKPLKAFVQYQREYGHGCPGNLAPDGTPVEDGMKEWLKILTKIELAFDLMHEEDIATDAWFAKGHEQQMKDYKKIQEGLKLLAKYYQNLWD